MVNLDLHRNEVIWLISAFMMHKTQVVDPICAKEEMNWTPFEWSPAMTRDRLNTIVWYMLKSLTTTSPPELWPLIDKIFKVDYVSVLIQ